MALRRLEKKAKATNARRRTLPRAVAIAARQRFLEHTQRRGVILSPGPPAAQDHAGDLSAPIPQRNSEPAVISALPALPAASVTPASAERPAPAAIPDSSATPASAEKDDGTTPAICSDG